MDIRLLPITEKHPIACPACEHDIYHLFSDRSSVPGGGYFIKDGDGVPGVWEKLREDQKKGACSQAMEVGSCRSCGASYGFAIATLIDVDNADGHADSFLYLNTDLGAETNYLCHPTEGSDVLPSQWFVHEFATKIGPMHYHYIGPFTITDEGAIRNWTGVTSCGRAADNADPSDPWVRSANMLLETWDAMLALNVKAMAEWNSSRPA
jgi:hypothetical protein